MLGGAFARRRARGARVPATESAIFRAMESDMNASPESQETPASPEARMHPSPARSPLLVSAQRSVLLVVDVQDKLLELMESRETLLGKLKQLAAAAQLLSVPCLATVQYPEKLGPLTASIARYLTPDLQAAIPGKLAFSCLGCDAAVAQLRSTRREQVVLVGLETHVCIAQTALDLVAAGLDVFLVVDAVAARHAIDHQTALRRLEAAGVTLITTEAVLFEWVEKAGTPEFKQISRLVRFGAED